jgi:hypothetical protein
MTIADRQDFHGLAFGIRPAAVMKRIVVSVDAQTSRSE